MNWNKSEIMQEFGKILVAKDAEREKPTENPFKEDTKTIEEKRLPVDEDLVEIAHPEPIYVAESRGDGGLVENLNEQHEKLMQIINKMPTGSLLGTYASVIDTLVKMADTCDEIEETDAADLLTDAAKKIAELVDTVPFVKAPATK